MGAWQAFPECQTTVQQKARKNLFQYLRKRFSSNASDSNISALSRSGLSLFGDSSIWKQIWSWLSRQVQALSIAWFSITQSCFISSTVIWKWTLTARFCKLVKSAHLKRNGQTWCFVFLNYFYVYTYYLLLLWYLWQENKPIPSKCKQATKRAEQSIWTALMFFPKLRYFL